MTDVRSFIEDVRERGLLKEVLGADWNLEIGAITDLNAKRHKYTLLFDEVKGYPKGFRVLTGMLPDALRVSIALGLPETRDDLELARLLKEGFKRAEREQLGYPPRAVNDSPLLENVDEGENVNLEKFPVPKWNRLEGGRYIGTNDLVITKDPDTGLVNFATYRVMLVGRDRLAIYIAQNHVGRRHMEKYFARGQPCPVAMVFGAPPDLLLMASTEAPQGVSKLNYAGAFLKEGIEVIEGGETGLPIPANAEIAIEGYIRNEMIEEGPFGEYYGYYAGGVMRNPVVDVKRVYYRSEPILTGTSGGVPPYDFSYFQRPTSSAQLWARLEAEGIPVAGVWSHEAGVGGFLVISIRQTSASIAHIVAHASVMRTGRYLVLVDEDINPADINQVIWAISTRADPGSIEVVRKIWSSPLDPLAERRQTLGEYTADRGIIYAIKPYERVIRGEFPQEVKWDEKTKNVIAEKYEFLK